LEDSVPWCIQLDIAIKTASGLDYKHKSDCIHCDLKPANIFLGGEKEDQWAVKIGDFGEAIAEWQHMTMQLS